MEKQVAKRMYNHAFTVAYEVCSADPDGATIEEHVAAITQLAQRLAGMTREQIEVGSFFTERPFDTYEITAG